MRRLLLVFVVLLGVTFCAAPLFSADDVFERSYRLPSGGTFTLANVNGSVWVEGWDREEVQISAVKSTRSNPEDLERVQIDVSASADAVNVRTIYPKDDGVEVTVDYRIRVPRRVLLASVQTVNGNLLVHDVEGSGDIHTVNGDVTLSDAVGRLNARTTNGTVQMELHTRQLSQAVELGVVNGLVLVALPDDFSANLEISSVNGDFHSALPVKVQGSMASREFRATLGHGGSPLRIRTVNGKIRVVQVRPTV